MKRSDDDDRALMVAFLVAVFRQATWRQRASILLRLAQRRR
ncbi:MAG: hypothetical protein M0Z95_18515 [Actinomycetota bacterium]|nr:hypothetical protein [Actinomycetota bacterium]